MCGDSVVHKIHLGSSWNTQEPNWRPYGPQTPPRAAAPTVTPSHPRPDFTPSVLFTICSFSLS
eukprot:2217691-Prymnesium_polylepis.1